MSDDELIKETMMLDYSQLVIHNVYMIKENKKLHSIIKEVREYILNTKMFTYGEEKEFFLKDYWYGKELLEIIDKINEGE